MAVLPRQRNIKELTDKSAVLQGLADHSQRAAGYEIYVLRYYQGLNFESYATKSHYN